MTVTSSLVVLGVWLIVSIIVGLAAGRFIRIGSDSDDRWEELVLTEELRDLAEWKGGAEMDRFAWYDEQDKGVDVNLQGFTPADNTYHLTLNVARVLRDQIDGAIAELENTQIQAGKRATG